MQKSKAENWINAEHFLNFVKRATSKVPDFFEWIDERITY